MAGYHDGLLPLLCIDFQREQSLSGKRDVWKRGVTNQVEDVDGKIYRIELLPARKHAGSRTSVGQQRLESTTFVVCSWKLQIITLQFIKFQAADYREWRASHQLEAPDASDDCLIKLLKEPTADTFFTVG